MTLPRPGLPAAAALLSLAAALLPAAPVRAEEPLPPRYELLFSPTLDSECGARLVSSAVTGTASAEERLFRPFGSGAGAAIARGARALVWDAPMAWWFGVTLHEAFGHGGRAREFNASPGVHLGSPWGGRDSYASFDLAGTSSEERLYIYIGGAEANTLAATLLERRAVEGVRMRPIELLYLLSNRLVASDYVLRTTPDPRTEAARFYGEYQGGGVARVDHGAGPPPGRCRHGAASPDTFIRRPPRTRPVRRVRSPRRDRRGHRPGRTLPARRLRRGVERAARGLGRRRPPACAPRPRRPARALLRSRRQVAGVLDRPAGDARPLRGRRTC